MKKRNLIFPSLVALTLPLVAVAHQDGSMVRHGFYAGGAAGLSRLTGDFDQSLTAGYSLFFPEGTFHFLGYDNRSFDENVSRGMGQIQGGYAIEWEWLFVGLEVSLNGSEMSLEHDSVLVASEVYEGYVGTLSAHSDVQLNNFEPVADLKLGFTLPTRTYLYGRVGAAFNTIKLHETTVYSQSNDISATISQYFRTSDTESVVGLRLGAGMEHKFFDRVSVALDYVYTNYGHVSTAAFQPTRFFTGGVNDYAVFDGTKVNVRRNMVTLGMNYYFW